MKPAPATLPEVYAKLKGFVENRYKAYSYYPDAPMSRQAFQHIASLREWLRYAETSTYQVDAAKMIIKHTYLFFNICSKNKDKGQKQQQTITDCMNVLRGFTGRPTA